MQRKISLTVIFVLSLTGALAQIGYSDNLDVSGGADLELPEANTGLEIENNLIRDENLEVNINPELTVNSDGQDVIIMNNDGETTTLRIMPQEAVAKVESELEISCEEECEVEIEEESVEGEERVVYEVTAEKQTRVLGLWNANAYIEASVDAQTGEIIDIDRPWWIFLASEVRAES